MKPRPTESKKSKIAPSIFNQSIFNHGLVQDQDGNVHMSGEVTQEEVEQRLAKRFLPNATKVFKRNDELTQTGFRTHEEAVAVADGLLKPGPDGSREDGKMRVRVALRQRTGLFDVVVKTAQWVGE